MSQKSTILAELRQLTEPADFATIATMIDAGQRYFELPNPATVFTAAGESDLDTLVAAIAEVDQPDILRSLVEYFDDRRRWADPVYQPTVVAELMPIYGLTAEQNDEVQKRLLLEYRGIGPWMEWEEFEREMEQLSDAAE